MCLLAWPVERQGRQLVSGKTDSSSIGEPFFQTSKAVSNLSLHAKPDLRVVLEWKINCSGSLIVAVMSLIDAAKGSLR